MPKYNKSSSSSVRFADDTKQAAANEDASPKRPAKQHPRTGGRPNEYEEDDMDEWEPSDNDDDQDAHTREIQQAHKKRRYQDVDEDELNATDINATTSLAAEGIAVEPFHMKQEETDGTGFFDGDTYIFRRDDKEEPDAWLDSLKEEPSSSSAIRPANKEQTREDTENMDGIEPTVLYSRMIPLVSESETVLKAIARYGNSMKRTPKGVTNQMAQDALNLLTRASNSLLLRGQVDIYEKTQKDLMQMLPPSSSEEKPKQQGEGKDAVQSNETGIQWEYEGRQDRKVHGPFSTSDMLSWIQAGYFVGESAVNVRTVQKKVKSMQDDLLDDLLDDGDDDDNSTDRDEYERGEWVLSDEVNFGKYQ